MSQHYVGYWLHFIPRKTTPCLKGQGDCPHCGTAPTPRWEGFLAVLHYPSRKPMILRITKGARDYCESLDEANGRLRGLIITARRLRPRNNSALRIELAVPHLDKQLPENAPNPDLEGALHRHWRIPSHVEHDESRDGEMFSCA